VADGRRSHVEVDAARRYHALDTSDVLGKVQAQHWFVHALDRADGLDRLHASGKVHAPDKAHALSIDHVTDKVDG